MADIEDLCVPSCEDFNPDGMIVEESQVTTTKMRYASVISASRRTDVMLRFREFLLSLQSGKIDVPNPFTKALSTVCLTPDVVKVIMFWSKDFASFVTAYTTDPKARVLLDLYKLAFQFTINDESHSLLEPGVCHTLDERLEQARFIVSTFGVDALEWRFDPIVLFEKVGDPVPGTKYLNVFYFEKIATFMAGLGVKEVKIAFCMNYRKAVYRMKKKGIIYVPWDLKLKQWVLDTQILPITTKFEINIKICSDPDILNLKGVDSSSCINAVRISKLGATLDAKSFKQDTGQKRKMMFFVMFLRSDILNTCHCKTNF